jgi:hypothetical protein
MKCVQGASLNLALLASLPLLLSDADACTNPAAPCTTISALALQLSATDDVLLAESVLDLSSGLCSWLPQHYVLVPAHTTGFLVFRYFPHQRHHKLSYHLVHCMTP